MDAAAALSFLEDLGDDEVAEFSDSDLEEGSDDDFENEYLYLGQDDDFCSAWRGRRWGRR